MTESIIVNSSALVLKFEPISWPDSRVYDIYKSGSSLFLKRSIAKPHTYIAEFCEHGEAICSSNKKCLTAAAAIDNLFFNIATQ